MPVTLVCKQCEREFTVVPSKAKIAKYCSKVCCHLAFSKRLILVCPNCGKEHEQQPSRKTKYCRECYSLVHAPVTHTCPRCGKEFKVSPSRITKYCSKECREQDAHVVTLACKQCGKEYQRFSGRAKASQYCSVECQRRGRRKRIICICQNCGKKFETIPARIKIGRGKYCSKECQYQAKNTQVTIICAHCEKEFKVKLCVAETTRWCSQECYGQYTREQTVHKRIVLICQQCGKEFKASPGRTKKYCDSKCYHKASKTSVARICQYCGKEFEVALFRVETAKFCSHKCQGMAWRGEQHPNWRGGLSFEPYTPDFNATLKREIRERDNYVCRLCGEPENGRALDTHHIDYDKKNSDPDNLIALCTKCHLKTNFNRNYWQAQLIAQMGKRHSKPLTATASMLQAVSNWTGRAASI